jgi:hypothetical protein
MVHTSRDVRFAAPTLQIDVGSLTPASPPFRMTRLETTLRVLRPEHALHDCARHRREKHPAQDDNEISGMLCYVPAF